MLITVNMLILLEKDDDCILNNVKEPTVVLILSVIGFFESHITEVMQIFDMSLTKNSLRDILLNPYANSNTVEEINIFTGEKKK